MSKTTENIELSSNVVSEDTTDSKVEFVGPGNKNQRKASVSLRGKMDESRLNGIVKLKFDFLKDTLNWAEKEMPAKYQKTIAVISSKLDEIKVWYMQQLIEGIEKNSESMKDVPLSEIEKRIAHHLDQQLNETMAIAHKYCVALAQKRDGFYDDSAAMIDCLYTSILDEFESTVLEKTEGFEPEEDEVAFKFNVGNCFLHNFDDQGLQIATGSDQLVPAHVVSVPFEHIPVLPLLLPLYVHELFHMIWVDTPNLWKETTKAVFDAISAADKEGKFSFKTESIKLGSVEVPSSQYVKGIYHDVTTELAADIFGVLNCGPAYLYNFLFSMPAINAAHVSAIDQINLVQTYSLYREVQEGRYMMDPHPPEYLRIRVCAEVLKLLGFEKEANECLELTDRAIGIDDPLFTWTDAEREREDKIELYASDLCQAASVAADTIINSPLKSLNGLSFSDLVKFTADKQDLVSKLAESFSNGETIEDEDIEPAMVVAAGSLAYWNEIKESNFPLVVPTTEKYVDVVKRQFSSLIKK